MEGGKGSWKVQQAKEIIMNLVGLPGNLPESWLRL